MKILKYTITLFVIIIFILFTYFHNRVIEMNQNQFGDFLEKEVGLKDLMKLKAETNSYYLLSYKPVSFNVFFTLGLDVNYSNIKISKKEVQIRKLDSLSIGDYVFEAECQNRFIFASYKYKNKKRFSERNNSACP